MVYILLDLEYHRVKDAKTNAIIEIGAVKLDEEMNNIGHFQSLVNNDISENVDGRILRLTKIRYNDIKKAPYFKRVMARFEEWAEMENNIIFVWGDTDKDILIENYINQNFRLSNTYYWVNGVIDLQKKFSKIYYRVFKKKQVGLEEAMKYYNIKMIKKHRALKDAEITAEIFKMMNKRLGLKNWVYIFEDE